MIYEKKPQDISSEEQKELEELLRNLPQIIKELESEQEIATSKENIE
jgi:hypothetical protein